MTKSLSSLGEHQDNVAPHLSIIVPTFNERENVVQLAGCLADVLKDRSYELIYVDDSTDDTPFILNKLAASNPRVRYIRRMNERGLGTAVVKGFETCRGHIVVVMDADFQHPPALLPVMLKTIDMNADIVIPSRFIPEGDDGGLNPVRKMISWIARYIGKILLRPLRRITDPTSGFFMFKKEVIKGVKLEPVGWKILIEVLIKGDYLNVVEVPYHFKARKAGESKMSLKEQLNYLRHILKLFHRQ